LKTPVLSNFFLFKLLQARGLAQLFSLRVNLALLQDSLVFCPEFSLDGSQVGVAQMRVEHVRARDAVAVVALRIEHAPTVAQLRVLGPAFVI